jgi:hypothetical protein
MNFGCIAPPIKLCQKGEVRKEIDQVFLTKKNFLYDEHWLARFSWGSNIYR